MKIEGKMFNLADQILLFLGIPIGASMFCFLYPIAFSHPEEFVLELLFFVPLFALCFFMILAGLVAKFAMIEVSETGVLYRYLFLDRKIGWKEVRSIEYPIRIHQGNFTPWVKFHLLNGKYKMVAFGSKKLTEFIEDLSIKCKISEKPMENKAVEVIRLRCAPSNTSL